MSPGPNFRRSKSSSRHPQWLRGKILAPKDPLQHRSAAACARAQDEARGLGAHSEAAEIEPPRRQAQAAPKCRRVHRGPHAISGVAEHDASSRATPRPKLVSRNRHPDRRLSKSGSSKWCARRSLRLCYEPHARVHPLRGRTTLLQNTTVKLSLAPWRAE